MKGYISTRVRDIVAAHVEAKGEAWLLNMGFGECNDFAASVLGIVSFEAKGAHIRFETVARNIRAYKAGLKRASANITATTEVVYAPC